MKTIVAGALGECVHVARVTNFLRLAEQIGWRTVFLGPAVPIDVFLQAVKSENADLGGVKSALKSTNEAPALQLIISLVIPLESGLGLHR